MIERVILQKLSKFRALLAGFLNALDVSRHGFGHLICLSSRNGKHTAHIFEGTFCAEFTKGNDLCNAFSVIALNDIFYNFASVLGTKINIDVRHAYAIGIEKTLKEKAVFKGVNLRDIQEIGDDAAGCGTSAGAHGNIVTARTVDDIFHNEEIALKAHAFDHA